MSLQAISVLSVNVAMPAPLHRWEGGEVVSGIDKKPVRTETLMLDRLNLEGDAQADTRLTSAGAQVHGGPDQAVYAFPSEHFPRIESLIARSVGPGFMGENVTVAGVVEDDVCIGDVWQWGDARLQVTSPRGPCYKLGIRIGRQAMRTVIRDEGLVGWYLRVLEPGSVPVAGPISVIERHPAGVTVGATHRAKQDRDRVFPELAALDVMSVNLRAQLLRAGRDLTGGVPEED